MSVIGTTYGLWTVRDLTPSNNTSGQQRWGCVCKCGTYRLLRPWQLKAGRTKSCGCSKSNLLKQKLTKNLKDRVFGKLTVLKQVANKKTKVNWLCLCECGVEKEVIADSLLSGATTSCGCNLSSLNNASSHPLFNHYRAMKERCYYTKHKYFKDYGGRGITVCDEWLKDPYAFFEYIGEKPTPDHSIDRIDPNGDYKPGNVRWADHVQQANNKRNKNEKEE